MELEIAIYCDFFPNFNMHIIWEEIRGGRPLWTTPNISILHGWRPGRRRDAEGWEARLFADVMVATASRSPGSPRGRGRFTNRGSPQPRDPLKNESGRVLYVFVTHASPSNCPLSGPTELQEQQPPVYLPSPLVPRILEREDDRGPFDSSSPFASINLSLPSCQLFTAYSQPISIRRLPSVKLLALPLSPLYKSKYKPFLHRRLIAR